MSNVISSPKTLNDLLPPHSINIVDVGASNGLANRWSPIQSLLNIIAFEPNTDANVINMNLKNAKTVVISKAVANSKGHSSLFLTRKVHCSSLLQPNCAMTDRYQNPERFDVLNEIQVNCTTVDAVLQELAVTMDFIKIDTQGTAFEVLKSAEHSLQNCIGIEVEVEFQQRYKNAKLFHEVDAYIHTLGFEIFDLRRVCNVRNVGGFLKQKKGQLIYADALYFQDWTKHSTHRYKLLKQAALLLIYGYVDVVMEMIQTPTALSVEDRQTLNILCQKFTTSTASSKQSPGYSEDFFIGTELLSPDQY